MIKDLITCKQFCPQVQHQSQVVYMVYRNNSKSFLQQQYHSIEEIDPRDSISYTKIQKSRYHQQIQESNKHNQLFTDSDFPSNNQSLGTISGRSKPIIWKRVRQFIKNPVLLNENIDSADTAISSSSDHYLLPTITALFQRSVKHLKRLFGQMSVSENGIYMVRVSFMGSPQQVVVDDYFPVYEATNQPVFAKPRQGNEIWEMIIEKVWAKLKGSYSNIQSGLPHDVLTAFSHSPCFYLDLNSEEPDFVWLHLQEASHNRFPTVASSRKDIPLDCGIRSLQTYTILGSYQLQAHGRVIAQVMKLICPTESEPFISQLSTTNKQFWDKINRDAKQTMGFYNARDSIFFFMSYNQFRKYFDSVDICHMRDGYNYNYEKAAGQSGSMYFDVEVEEESEVYFTLHQNIIKSNSNNMSVYGRMIILLAKVIGDDYQYIVSKMQMNFSNVSVRCPNILKGRYIVYTKCYRKVSGKDNQCVLAVYSKNRVSIKRRNKQLCESFIQRVFLSHAYANPDKTYLNHSVDDWICTKMLYNEGGFAYIAAHVQAPSNKKIRIEFDTKVFQESGFKIKEPYNKVGKGRIIAEAGKPCIMVCRLLNNIPHNLVFPPDVKIQQTI